MPLAQVFDRCFSPLMGRPCWQVKRGHGSFITLEFGEPHLEVREPRDANPDTSPKLRGLYARRNVTVRGEWHLWVYCSNWSVHNSDGLIGCSDGGDAAIDSATGFLDGQALVAVDADESATFQFVFDLGGRLRTTPCDDNSEQWMLYQPDGFVLTLRADGMYCHSPSRTDQNAEQWVPAWTPK